MRIAPELFQSGPASTLDMSEVEIERRAIDLRAACIPSLYGQSERLGLHVAPYSTGTGAARGRMARAISWLAACADKALIAYGEAMYSDFADFGGHLDYQNTETATQPRSDAQNEHEDWDLPLRPTTAGLVGQEHGIRGAGVARVWIMFPIARSWSWISREWEGANHRGASEV